MTGGKMLTSFISGMASSVTSSLSLISSSSSSMMSVEVVALLPPTALLPSLPPPCKRLESLPSSVPPSERRSKTEMLEAARASSFTEDTPLTGGGLKQFEKMRDEHFAEVASQSGAFGFARSIEEQLAQFVATSGDG